MGRILGLDYGSKRIGVAISDERGEHVFPREVLLNTGRSAVQSALRRLIKEEHIELIVVGLPLTMRGEAGPQAKEIQVAIEELQHGLDVPLLFEDERLTSALADQFTHSSFSRDSLAAAAILESYLQRRRSK